MTAANIDPSVIEAVARRLMGEPKSHLSSQTQLRFGTRGSMAIDLKRGVFYDHDAGEGGGVLDLGERQLCLAHGAAFDWLVEQDLAERRERRSWNNRIEEAYRYEDARGDVAFEVVRLRNPKDFRQRRPNGEWGVKGITKTLYRLFRL